jgi:hypothetical protein
MAAPTGDPFGRVLEALGDRVVRRGDDRNPSLSIARGEEGCPPRAELRGGAQKRERK